MSKPAANDAERLLELDPKAVVKSAEKDDALLGQVEDFASNIHNAVRQSREEKAVKKEKEEKSASFGYDTDSEKQKDGESSIGNKRGREEEEIINERNASSTDDDWVESGEILTLTDMLLEKKMVASRAHVGKGPRNERELLRFYVEVGAIKQRSKWEWDSNDPELDLARKAMDKYKGGLKAPNRKKWEGFCKSTEWEKYIL